MNKNIYRNYPIDPEDEDYGYGASVYDCTGLIPSEPQSDEELESYEEIYPFLPPEEETEG